MLLWINLILIVFVSDALGEFMEELGASSPGIMALTSLLSKVSVNFFQHNL